MKYKNIIVTGGAGFLGSHVVDLLGNYDCNVFVPKHKYYELEFPGDVERLFDNKPKTDLVIHLAAEVGGIGYNQKNPATLFYNNMMMGIELLDEAHGRGIKKFATLGTICAYPKFCPVPFEEEDIWNGYPEETNAPYGLAKKMLLVQSQAYRQQYNFNSIVLFPVNMYGPRDNFDLENSHVIPALIRKFVTARNNGDRSVTLWGDGSPTREFLYVEDCAEAIVKAVEVYDSSEPVNIGTGKEIAIGTLAFEIRDLVGYQGDIIWDSSKPNGQPRRCLDVSRAKRVLDWKAKTSLRDGLIKTIKWYENEHL